MSSPTAATGRPFLRNAIALLALASALCALGLAGSARIAPASPGLVNASPDSTVLIVPTDGRAPQPIARIRRGTDSFVPLGSLACALGVPFSWDSYSYRGWIQTDSIRTEFTLDSPILNHGDGSLLMDTAIGYDAHGVLIPVDYLALLRDTWNAGRTVSWRPADGIFRWGAATPSFRQLRVGQTGHQSILRVPMRSGPKGTTLLWSPVGRLEIVLDGVSVAPESLSVGGSAHGGALFVRAVTGAPGGSRIRLDVGPSAIGASVGYDAREGAWDLATTESVDEVGHGGFRGLQHVASADRDSAGMGAVVIAPFFDRAIDPAEADSALSDLARRIATTLADTLLLPAEILSYSSPLDAATSANAVHARCVIALRLDRYATGTGRIQIWSAVPRLRWEPVDLTQSLRVMPARPLLWSETPALAENESRRIAVTLASHLSTVVGEDRVDVGSRPSRWLEGFTMPAAIIYPAQANDPLSIERLLDEAQRADLARAIAFGISEAVGAGTAGVIQ